MCPCPWRPRSRTCLLRTNAANSNRLSACGPFSRALTCFGRRFIWRMMGNAPRSCRSALGTPGLGLTLVFGKQASRGRARFSGVGNLRAAVFPRARCVSRCGAPLGVLGKPLGQDDGLVLLFVAGGVQQGDARICCHFGTGELLREGERLGIGI